MPSRRIQPGVGRVRRRAAQHRLVGNAAADRKVRHSLHRRRKARVRRYYRTDRRVGSAQQHSDPCAQGGRRVGIERTQDVDHGRSERRLRHHICAHERRRAAADHGVHRGTGLQGHRVQRDQGDSGAVALRDHPGQLRSAGGERARRGRPRFRRCRKLAGGRAHSVCRRLHRDRPGSVGHGLRMGQAASRRAMGYWQTNRRFNG